MTDHTFEGLTRRDLTFHGETRPVWSGGSGAPVILIHEAPGLTPGALDYGRTLIDAGFRVHMPSVIGTPGKPFSNAYVLQTLTRACVSREFSTWALGRSSPITVWLRALARSIHDEHGGPGVGVIGMCLTGGFALAMMVDGHVAAPVLSQPSLPFPVSPSRRHHTDIDPDSLERVREQTERGARVMGLRFSHDPICPPQRFEQLREVLGDAFLVVEIDSSPGNPHGIPRTAHGVLVHDHVPEPDHPTEEARHRVVQFLRERLGGAPGT